MTPLLMIPGPIEVSPRVVAAYSQPPPSHLAASVIEAFGASLANMRQVWCANPTSQPFAIPGSGTLAMEMAVTNLVDPGERVMLVNSGYFSDRMAEMVRRRGAKVVEARAKVGRAPDLELLAKMLDAGDYAALFATHVDTSTGVRVDAEAIARLARERGILSVFDGVCATAAERFEMAAWGADVYLCASQKAIGLPIGLALMVASESALAKRAKLKTPPPLSIDFEAWQPIMQAYEERRPSYFSTPATNLLLALDVALKELLACQHRNGDEQLEGMAACFAKHQQTADAMRAAWRSAGLELLCQPAVAANTLSAIRYPTGVDSTLTAAIKKRGVVVAGGLHPECKTTYFRVGHMGDVIHHNDKLLRTVSAVMGGLKDCGYAVDAEAAHDAAAEVLA